jgi:DNA helicase-2/ATP-dependent DNA helicase PcrA
MSVTEDQLKRITEEEETLRAVHESLEQQISWSYARLRTEEQRAQDLTQSIVAARRDVDKQMLASDEAVAHQLRDAKRDEIETLAQLKEKPYFARIILEEENQNGKIKEIEYKLGVAANTDCRIIDWRKAPIAKLYYEYKEGDEFSEEILGRSREGVVKVRNKVDIEDGELIGLACGLGVFSRHPETKEWTGQQHAQKAGRRNKRGQLPNVLQLITAEQFRMITDDAQSAVLIQGIAGSGKTTVALYRLAWLLHEDNSDLRSNEAAIVVFSKTLQRYINDALPSLGISDVDVLTFSEWAAPTLRRLVPTFCDTQGIRLSPMGRQPGIDRVKRSMATLLRLEEYADQIRSAVFSQLRSAATTMTIPPAMRLQIDKSLASTQKVLACLADLRSIARGLAPAAGLEEFSQFVDALIGKVLDYPYHLQALFSQPEALLYWDESKLLDRDLILRCKEHTSQLVAQQTVELADLGLLLRLSQCFGQLGKKRNGENGPFRHLVIDEVQDFGASELAACIASVENTTQLTIVGDTSQQVGDHASFPGWEKLRSHWSLGDELSQFHFLSVSHRSTLQIMRLGDHVLGEKRTTTGRPGSAPLWYHCRGEQTMVAEALSWLTRVTNKFPDMLLAVICSDDEEARYVHSLLTPTFPHTARLGTADDFTFDEGILVTTVREVKGLEFEAVMIWNVSARTYPDREGARRRLYVAITRAEEYVCIVSHTKPSPLLPSIDSKLVRGFLEEPPEEDAEE